MIREAKFADLFYPRAESRLRKKIAEFLNNVDTKMYEDILGLIVPHAGYDFSGQTAAYAYKQIENSEFRNIIILGPSHRYPLEGGAVSLKDGFKTPLGIVQINHEICKKVLDTCDLIKPIEEAHDNEHSIEVQLPFLQVMLKNWQLVPVLLGAHEFRKCLDIAKAISSIMDDSTLLIISSDFYHGYNYSECVATQKTANDLIQSFSAEEFFDYYLSNEKKGICIACGGVPITIGMLIAERTFGKEIKLLYATNSCDVIGGAKSGYVVGYSAFGILR